MSSIDALERCVGALKSAADLRKMEDRRDAATAEGLTFDGSATAGRDERRAGTRTTVCTPASASPLHSYAYHKSAARLITAARVHAHNCNRIQQESSRESRAREALCVLTLSSAARHCDTACQRAASMFLKKRAARFPDFFHPDWYCFVELREQKNERDQSWSEQWRGAALEARVHSKWWLRARRDKTGW